MGHLEHLWAGWRSSYIETTTEKVVTGPEGCVFCGILASGLSDEEAHVVWRDDSGQVVAILNAYPYASGHVLVMPSRHVDNLTSLSAAETTALWDGVTRATQAIGVAYSPDGLNVGANIGRAAGAGVPGHLHVHVVPRWAGDTNFITSVADARVLPEPLGATDAKLRAAWSR